MSILLKGTILFFHLYEHISFNSRFSAPNFPIIKTYLDEEKISFQSA